MPLNAATAIVDGSDFLVQPDSESRELVVILHGWTGSRAVMKDVRAVVAGRPETRESPALPHADVLVPDYPAKILANTSAFRVAWDVIALITAAVQDREKRGGKYERIILVGHSAGAILLRKVVVWALGQTQDAPFSPQAQKWAGLIDRVILFAGMNRGWTVNRRPDYTPWLRWLFLRLLEKVTRRLPVGRFVRHFQRGAPFLADLRMQWLNLVHRGGTAKLATTIQLLGTKDDLVNEQDSVDLEAAKKFVYIILNGAGHLNCVHLCPEQHPTHEVWRDSFQKALTQPADQIEGDPIQDPLHEDTDVTHVVFVVHGIRDEGNWTSEVRQQLQLHAQENGQKVVVCTPSYGYFPMGNFLLLSERQKNVRWFMDEYTETRAKYPNAGVSFIGHSNGTYLLASALRRYKTPVFDRVVFAGSVVPRAFEWDDLVKKGRLSAIQNYVATGDWVVGWFPAFYEWTANIFGRVPDLGSAGHNGFLNDSARELAITFARGGHGAALRGHDAEKQPVDNYANLARFALGGSVAPHMIPNLATEKERSAFVSLGHKLCPMIWLALVIGVIWFLVFPALWPWISSFFREPPDFNRLAWEWVLFRALLVWLLLTRI